MLQHGITPLRVALEHERYRCVQYLLRSGAAANESRKTFVAYLNGLKRDAIGDEVVFRGDSKMVIGHHSKKVFDSLSLTPFLFCKSRTIN